MEHKLQSLERFAAQNGHALVPVKQMDGDIRLGAFVSYLRTMRKKGVLPSDVVRRVEALPGWTWNARTGPKPADPERERQIKELRDQGLTYAAIGDKFGISRQRVHQVLTRDR